MTELPHSAFGEIVIQGVPASPGAALGKAHVHQKAVPDIDSSRIDESMIPAQITLFENGRETLRSRWQKLMQKEPNEESKAIIAAQIEIINDPELATQVEGYIRDERDGAQKAINKAFTNYIELLAETGNDRMESRLIDLTDIRDRLIEATGAGIHSASFDEVDILVSKEVSPREVIQMSHQNVKGFVMEQGGNTSHAAIIARSMGIPAVVGAKGTIKNITEETTICLNGESGLVAINPSDERREQIRLLTAGQSDSLENKMAICEQPSRTSDDHPFEIRANIEFVEELQHAGQFGAHGIGLLRTESMYLNSEEFATLDNQVEFYGDIVSKGNDYPVTIRLFDVGGDKYQGAAVEENNPFLGWRGIRMLLDNRSLLRQQLKAILHISHRHPGRVKVLVPMVSTVAEIEAVKEELQSCRKELAKEGMQLETEIPVGMMVEIPSAAIHADHFARKVDFFSIGTNDLTQYLLAVDRGNALIAELYDQRHPSVWKIINHVLSEAKKHGTGVEICGELASYPVAASCLVGMGAATLSMSPASIPTVKRMLIHRSFNDMKALSEQVLLCEDLADVKSLFKNWKENYRHE